MNKAGVIVATAITAFVHPGEEVIILEPAYDSYIPSILINGGVVVSYALSSPSYKVDWDAFGRLITAHTKMIIINNPQNPIGQIFTEDDLLQLQNLLKGTDIILLSDEVYEHLVYDGQRHQSALKFPELYKIITRMLNFRQYRFH